MKDLLNLNLNLALNKNIKQSKKTRVSLSCMQKYLNSLPAGFNFNYPKQATLKITSECNLRCKHCFYSDYPESYSCSDIFSTNEIYDLINFLVDDINILNIVFTGGEPFARADFIDILKYTKQKYIPIIIQSNGTLITNDIVSSLASTLNLKRDILQISLEGVDEKSHDYIRGEGTYKKTIEAIKKLTKENIPVQINFTLTSISVSTMHNIYELCKELNVKKASINRFKICNEKHKFLAPKLIDVFQCNSKILQKREYYPDIEVNIKTVDIFDFLKIQNGQQLLDDYIQKNNFVTTNKCLSCHKHDRITISADGNVFLCSMDESEDAIIGNLRKQHFYDIWENRFNTPYFQKRDMTTTMCKDCKYISLCNTGCMASAYKQYKDINAAPAECPYYDEYIRSLNG